LTFIHSSTGVAFHDATSTDIGITVGAFVALFFIVKLLHRLAWAEYKVHVPLDDKLRQEAIRRPYTDKMPAPFPNSWYKVCESHELAIGDVKPMFFLGQELVVFRAAGEADGTGRGEVHVLDAYCPHLGAHLGVGGKVNGNSVECPFHGWQFNGDGKCTHIPYSSGCSSIPPQAKTNSWIVREVNGQIFIWYDVDLNPPSWEVPVIPGMEKPNNLRFHGKSIHEIACHIAEIPENGADTAHLDYLHTPFLSSLFPFFSHTWSAEWIPRESEPHLADLTVSTHVAFNKKPISFTRVDSKILQVGPSIVHLRFPTPFGNVYVIETITPMRAFQQHACNIVWADKHVPRFIAKFILNSLVIQFERDVPIWCHKKFIRAPLVVKGDGPLLKFRRWFLQFYSANGTKTRPNLDW